MKANNIHTILIVGAIAALSTACTGNVISPNATTPQTAQAVSLETQEQEVKRYDCNGNLTSDQLEVIQAPTELMAIQPTKANWTPSMIATSSFMDLQTGQSAPLIIGGTTFTIDHGNGALNMEVKGGLNQINYTFSFTDGTTEVGSRFINVSWDEKILSGFLTYRPDPTSCPLPPKP